MRITLYKSVLQATLVLSGHGLEGIGWGVLNKRRTRQIHGGNEPINGYKVMTVAKQNLQIQGKSITGHQLLGD